MECVSVATVELKGMSSKFEPPTSMDNTAGYPEYKKKLLQWSQITKVPKEQQAEVVLYLHHLDGKRKRL